VVTLGRGKLAGSLALAQKNDEERKLPETKQPA
jgi:hypothetical protein